MSDSSAAEYRDNQDEDVIVVEDETLRQGFTQIPNAILRKSDLSPGAKLAYMGLLSYAWQKGSCFPGQERLAEDLGVSKRSVITYLKQLQKAGLLQVTRRGLGKTNLYVLPKTTNPDPGHVRSAESASQEVKETSPQEVQNLRIEEDSLENKQNEESSNLRMVTPDKNESQIEPIGSLLAHRSAPVNTSSETPSDRDILTSYMQSIALELRDQAPLRSTVTRLLRIYDRSQAESIQAFVDVLYQARSITREYTSSIRAGEPGARRIMPYFLAVVEDLVGLREHSERARRSGT